MKSYRVGGHWAVTIIEEGSQPADRAGRRPDDELVAVIVNGDKGLAQRIVAALNERDPHGD